MTEVGIDRGQEGCHKNNERNEGLRVCDLLCLDMGEGEEGKEPRLCPLFFNTIRLIIPSLGNISKSQKNEPVPLYSHES